MAAASVGIVSPLSEVDGINRNFTETKEEIEKLINNDSSLYERGGTLSSIQSGEEYRQTLRKELQIKRNEIINMPWKAGSGIKKGKEQGMFFCAKVGERNYLRFIHTDEQWQPKKIFTNNDESNPTHHIEIEIGKCLRLIECDETASIYTNEKVLNSAYELWEIVKNNIYNHWNRETDPKNLQPKVRPLNRKVAEFIRENRPAKIDNEDIEKALDILESPWSRRDEKNLKFWFEQDNFASNRATFLIEKILQSGLEAFICPDPLPPIEKHEIELIVWMALKDK